MEFVASNPTVVVASTIVLGAASAVSFYFCRGAGERRRSSGRIPASSAPIQMIIDNRIGPFKRWLGSQGQLDQNTLLDLAMNATYRGNAKALSEILETKVESKSGLRLRECFGSGGWNSNPLFVAIKRGKSDCVKVLLDKGVPIELGFNWDSWNGVYTMPIIDKMAKDDALTGELKKMVDKYRKQRRYDLSEKLKRYGLNRRELDPITILIAEYIGV
uniref:Ankyrin repeat domain-containing protein n=1 Tax=Lotharella oceanica TaxID=641309 RepID=A0A7S2TGP9_9EUKA